MTILKNRENMNTNSNFLRSKSSNCFYS